MVNGSSDLDSEFEKHIINPLEDELKNLKINLSENGTKLETLDKSIQSKHKDYANGLSIYSNELNTYRNEVVTKITKCLNSSRNIIDSGKKIFNNCIDHFYNQLLKNVALVSFLFIVSVFFLGIRGLNTDVFGGNHTYLLGNSFPINSKVSNMLINLLLVLLYIVAIFLSVYISRQKSKTKLKLTQESFTTNINALENDTSSIRQLKDKPYSTDLCSIDSENKKKQEVFREFANSFQDSITVFKRTIPAYREINEMEKYREKWHLECNKLKTVVAFFGLDELKDIIDNVGKTPVIKLKGSDDRTIKSSIINSVCERAFFDEVLMNLFVSYYEESRKTENIWEQIKVDNNKLHPLAEILLKLKKLNFDKDVLTGNILQKILAKTQFFNLTLITNNVSLYIRIRKFLINYREKLHNENIFLEIQLNDEEIVENISFEDTFENNFLNVFCKELHQSLNVNFKDAYVDALVAIILNQDINFRDEVCKIASRNDEAVYVLMAYHDLRKQKGEGNEQFLLSNIFDQGETPSQMKEKIEIDQGSKKTYQYFKLGLSRGEWYESSQIITQKMIKELSDRIDHEQKYRSLKIAFTKVLTKVNINTLDKAVDAGLFSVYLILTSKPAKGRFLDNIVDKLSVRSNKCEKRKKGTSTRSYDTDIVESFKSKFGISLLFDSSTPIYDFEKYSASTRIGILDKKISFTTFVDRINKDIEKLLKAENEKDPTKKWEDIGFIVLRISPSKYSFGIMNEKIEKTCNVTSTNLDIAKKIATLASDYLSDAEKTVISTFDNTVNLVDIIEQLTIFDFMSPVVQKEFSKYNSFLKDEDLRVSIYKCLEENGIDSFKQLSIFLHHDKELKNKLKNSFSSCLDSLYFTKRRSRLNKSTQEVFVNEFLDTLESLNEIWNM